VGLVASLARPGGNLSGVTDPEMDTKGLELLHEMIPTAHRVALLHDARYDSVEHTAALEAAAHHLGIAVEVVEIRQPEEVMDALQQARAGGVEAVNVLDSPMFLENITSSLGQQPTLSYRRSAPGIRGSALQTTARHWRSSESLEHKLPVSCRAPRSPGFRLNNRPSSNSSSISRSLSNLA